MTEGRHPDLSAAPTPEAEKEPGLVVNFEPESQQNQLLVSQQDIGSENEDSEPTTPLDVPEEDLSDRSMTLVEHLDELRVRIVRGIVYICLGFMASLFFCKDVMRFLQVPAGNITFQALSLEEPIVVFFKVSFYMSLVIASPFILFEVCKFVGPGLTRKERKILTPFVLGSPILFLCGAAFAYYCLLPPMLHFFGSFGAGVTPINQRLDFYISLVTTIMMYMGLCFQLPIVIFALSFTGLVTSTQLIKIWRWAVFGSSVVALVITPDPTAFSMLMVMGALIGLYSMSVLLLRLFGR